MFWQEEISSSGASLSLSLLGGGRRLASAEAALISEVCRLQRLLHLLRHQRCGKLVEIEPAVAILVVLRDVRPRLFLRHRLAVVNRPGEDADELFDGEDAVAVRVELGEGVAQLASSGHC